MTSIVKKRNVKKRYKTGIVKVIKKAKARVDEAPATMTSPKEKEKQEYILWKTLGPLRGMSEEKLEAMGINDPIIMGLAEIKNQSQFARAKKVRMSTLSNWNKSLDMVEFMEEMYGWMKSLTPGVMMSMHKNIKKRGGAPEVKLWQQLVHDWVEGMRVQGKITHELGSEDKELLDKLMTRNK